VARSEAMSDIAREISISTDRMVAPRLIKTEMANALVRKTMQGTLSLREASDHLRRISFLLPELIDIDDMIAPAFHNACLLHHPIYDLIYLETARRLDVQLITADSRFIARLADTDLARHVTLLSDWRPE
jgi:hypothetical protein